MEFTVGSALSFGWETFKKRPWFFIGASVVIAIAYIAVSVVGSIIDTVLGGTAEDPTLAASLFNFLWSCVGNLSPFFPCNGRNERFFLSLVGKSTIYNRANVFNNKISHGLPLKFCLRFAQAFPQKYDRRYRGFGGLRMELQSQ